MTKINKPELRKYSKEWFVTNGSEKQKNAIRSLGNVDFKKLGLKKNIGLQVLDKNLLVGSKKNVIKNYEKLLKSNEKKDIEQVELIKTLGGIDVLFDILNADDNKKISGQEVEDLAAISTKELEEDDTWLQAWDLEILYNNLIAADGAEVQRDEVNNETKYSFKDGTSTTVIYDEDGNIDGTVSTRKTFFGNDQTKYHSFKENAIKTVEYDSKGREVFSEYNFQGTEKDFSLRTSYNNDEVNSVIETNGKTVRVKSDKDGNVMESSIEKKYKLEDTPFEQNSVEECWLLAQSEALLETPVGKQIIDESIVENDDGSVTVNLKGADKSYTFSAERMMADEYVDLSKKYATGNYKIRALELAFTKLRQEMLDDTNMLKFKVKYSYDADKEDPLRTGYFKEAFYFITGVEPETAYLRNNIEEELNKKQNNPEQYAMVTSFLKKDPSLGVTSKGDNNITNWHEYSISKVTEDTVYLINPWNSAEELAYPREKFMKNAFGVGSLDLEKCKEQ